MRKFLRGFRIASQNTIDDGTPDSGLHGMFHGLTPAAWVLFQIAFIHLEREYEKQKDNASVPSSIQAPRSRLLRQKCDFEVSLILAYVERPEPRESERVNVLCSEPKLV